LGIDPMGGEAGKEVREIPHVETLPSGGR